MAPSNNIGRSCCAYCPCQQPAPGPRSEPSPPVANTHVHLVLPLVIVFLAVLAVVCILCLFRCRFRSPTPQSNDTRASSISPESEVTPQPQYTRRGATRNAVQTHPVLPVVTDPVTDGNARGPGSTSISSPAGNAVNPSVGSRRQPGVCAGSEHPPACGSQNTLSSTADVDLGLIHSHEQTLPDGLGCEPCLRPAPTVESLSRGAAVNPIQIERSPFQPISAFGTIEKSLFPGTLDVIESGPNDDEPSQALSPQLSRHVAFDRTPLVAQHITTWFILVIAVGVDDLKDPETDLSFILRALKSATVHLVSLLNGEATHTSIQYELLQLCRQAQQHHDSRLLVYLTGLGEQSGMRLFDDAILDAEDLKRWLAELYAQPTHPRPPLGVIFDVCRPTRIFKPGPDFDLAIVWSCSIGQLAYALGFGPELPSSCFLTSLFLAAHDDLVGSMTFEDAFTFRLAQQGDLLRFVYQRKHEGDKPCGRCATNSPCDSPSPQKSEYGQAGRDTLLALGELIKSEFPDVAHRVHADVTKRMTCWKFLDAGSRAILAPSVGYGACSTRHSSKSHRGSTEATVQAAAPILTVDS